MAYVIGLAVEAHITAVTVADVVVAADATAAAAAAAAAAGTTAATASVKNY